MIISHKFKFIFIRVPKTASTSLQFELGKICDEKDVVTPIKNPPITEHIARNYDEFKQHTSARKIKNAVSPQIWQNYFKFCFERNPFDKMVSSFWYKKFTGKFQGTFKEFCVNCLQDKKNFPKGWSMYTINDQVVVDFIAKYENLENDFQFIADKLNLPLKEQLPKEKYDIREIDKHYSQYYDEETKEIVQSHYQKELDFFGYKFESRNC